MSDAPPLPEFAASLDDAPMLDGVRVVEIGDLGEVAGRLLADAGADVIRVEPPSGAASRHIGPYPADEPGVEASLRFAAHNANKRSVTLDLAHAEGRDLWRRLCEGADVVIDAAGHGVLDSLDVGWEARLAGGAAGPRVWCSITPFGREGPWAAWASSDLVQLALGGPMMSTGYSDHELPPIRGGFDHSHWMAGEYAVVGILGALIGLDAGAAEGPELVDLAIHDAVSATTEGAFPSWEYRREINQRATGRHSAPGPTPEIQYPTADGRHMNVIGAGMPRSMRNLDGLLDWMDRYDATENLREPRFREAIHAARNAAQEERQHFAEVAKRFVARLTTEEAYRGGQSLHLPWGIVRRPEENLDDPHWTDRDSFAPIELPDGQQARLPVAPYRFEGVARAQPCRAPLLGEHNHAVYHGELGVPAEDLPGLAERGAI